MLNLFDVIDLLTGGIDHVPAVGVFRCAVLDVVVVERHGFDRPEFEVLNEKEGVALRVFAVLDEPQDDGLVFVGMSRPLSFGGRFAVGKMDVTANLLPVGFKVKC